MNNPFCRALLHYPPMRTVLLALLLNGDKPTSLDELATTTHQEQNVVLDLVGDAMTYGWVHQCAQFDANALYFRLSNNGADTIRDALHDSGHAFLLELAVRGTGNPDIFRKLKEEFPS